MPRSKTNLAFITNYSARKCCYKKRIAGLEKKFNELCTLCGIDACAIVYSPYETHPKFWPNYSGVQKVVAQFQKMPKMAQSKNMVNQELYIKERIKKVDAELKKLAKKNRKEVIDELMYKCLVGKVSLDNLDTTSMDELGLLVGHKILEVRSHIESLKKVVHAVPSQSHQPQSTVTVTGNITDQMIERGVPVPVPVPVPVHEFSMENQPIDGNLEMMDMIQSPTDFMDFSWDPNEHN